MLTSQPARQQLAGVITLPRVSLFRCEHDVQLPDGRRIALHRAEVPESSDPLAWLVARLERVASYARRRDAQSIHDGILSDRAEHAAVVAAQRAGQSYGLHLAMTDVARPRNVSATAKDAGRVFGPVEITHLFALRQPRGIQADDTMPALGAR